MTTYPFSREPTAAADDAAAYMREWYEAHRESHVARLMRRECNADEFMLALLNKADEINTARRDRLNKPETKP